MKREALIRLNRYANEQNLDQSFKMDISYDTARGERMGFDTVAHKMGTSSSPLCGLVRGSDLESVEQSRVGA